MVNHSIIALGRGPSQTKVGSETWVLRAKFRLILVMQRVFWTLEFVLCLVLISVLAVFASAPQLIWPSQAQEERPIVIPRDQERHRDSADLNWRAINNQIDWELKRSRFRALALLSANKNDLSRDQLVESLTRSQDHIVQSLAYRQAVHPKARKTESLETFVLIPSENNRAGVSSSQIVALNESMKINESIQKINEPDMRLHILPGGTWVVRVAYRLIANEPRTWIVEDWRVDHLLRVNFFSSSQVLMDVTGAFLGSRRLNLKSKPSLMKALRAQPDSNGGEEMGPFGHLVFRRLKSLPVYFVSELPPSSQPLHDSAKPVWIQIILLILVGVVALTSLFYMRWVRPLDVLLEATGRMLDGRVVGLILRRRKDGRPKAWWVGSMIRQLASDLESLAARLKASARKEVSTVEKISLQGRLAENTEHLPPIPTQKPAEVAEESIVLSPPEDPVPVVTAIPTETLVTSIDLSIQSLLRVGILASAQFPLEISAPSDFPISKVIGWLEESEGQVIWKSRDEVIVGFKKPDLAIKAALLARQGLKDLSTDVAPIDWRLTMVADSSSDSSEAFERGRRLIKLAQKVNADLLVTHDLLKKTQLTYLIDQGSGYRVRASGAAIHVLKVHGYISEAGERIVIRGPELTEDTESVELRPINHENVIWLDERKLGS